MEALTTRALNNSLTARDRWESLRPIASPSATIPPRASLMGLPLELRQQIYEYVITPTVDYAKGAKRGSHHFLATCRQVFQEAMPIRYRMREFKIDGTWGRMYSKRVLDRLVPYAFAEISRVWITGSPAALLALNNYPTTVGGTYIEYVCLTIGTLMPKVRELRISLRPGDAGQKMDYGPFEAVIKCMDLRKVVVHDDQIRREGGCEEVLKVIRQAADRERKAVAVVAGGQWGLRALIGKSKKCERPCGWTPAVQRREP